MENEPAHEPRGQKTLQSKPSTWYPGEARNIAKFPNVLGAIDCTHVRIQSPGGDNGELFRNRKLYFSLSVRIFSRQHQTEAERLYNESEIRPRNTIELCFGVLKR
ncbi:uncharacterized protein LOC119561849 [Drosophila subpulchrella]|uniref:uncharacterized protein LOC119561849 n=1 Tax=Drosophila subpulchrella TaxID=1486046 RepID=UPI0018A15876|nr:uncharacterized protein LOC119561849 [Drosophila subpulchrella]